MASDDVMTCARLPAAGLLAALMVVVACDGDGDVRPAPDGGSIDAGVAPDAPFAIADADLFEPPAAESHRRADVVMQTLLLAYWDGARDYLVRTPAPSFDVAYWNFAQGFDAVLDQAERTGRFAGTVETLYEGQAAHGWMVDLYDDENWMTMALVRTFDVTGRADALAEAIRRYDDIRAAWDETCCGATPGGIWWDRAHTQKATAINAGAVITGVLLYERTSDPALLEFATRTYDFWIATMVDGATGQVLDHSEPTGEIFRWKFTYNDGLMLGAALALHRVTGDARYLEDARARADFMLANETVATPFGPVLSDGDATMCRGDCVLFKGIGYRWLAAYSLSAPERSDVRDVLRASALSIWSVARYPASGLIGADWAAPPAEDPLLITQTISGAMALERFAILTGEAPPDPSDWTQAEEGVLHGVDLASDLAGYDGWGYTSSSADGSSVAVDVASATAKEIDLEIRYAAPAGDAVRVISPGPGGARVPVTFAASTAWTTARARVALAAPVTRVSIVFAAAEGGSGELYVDGVR